MGRWGVVHTYDECVEVRKQLVGAGSPSTVWDVGVGFQVSRRARKCLEVLTQRLALMQNVQRDFSQFT